VAAECPQSVPLPRAYVDVVNPAGVHRLVVEVADTAPSRAAGLMCRDSLASGTGMLLVYPKPQRAKIWMKNTRIPLDIIFIGSDDEVVKIVEQAAPGQSERIPSDRPVTRVLELPAGDVRRYELQVGDRLRWVQ
jgi:uncharacterized protein